MAYMQGVLDRLIERLPDVLASEPDSFIYQFREFHEDMHTEAFIWARQTLAYPTPNFANEIDAGKLRSAGAHAGFAAIARLTQLIRREAKIKFSEKAASLGSDTTY